MVVEDSCSAQCTPSLSVGLKLRGNGNSRNGLGPNEKMRPLPQNHRDSGREGRSVEPLDDRAIDREVGGSKLCAAGTCQQAILYECEDLEFFTNLAAIALADGVLRPFEQLGIPGRAIIGRVRRNPA